MFECLNDSYTCLTLYFTLKAFFVTEYQVMHFHFPVHNPHVQLFCYNSQWSRKMFHNTEQRLYYTFDCEVIILGFGKSLCSTSVGFLCVLFIFRKRRPLHVHLSVSCPSPPSPLQKQKPQKNAFSFIPAPVEAECGFNNLLRSLKIMHH